MTRWSSLHSLVYLVFSYCFLLSNASAISPASGNVIGALSVTKITKGETLSDIARIYNLGYTEIRIANPKIDPWLPQKDAEVLVPDMHLLPSAPKEGIIINVPEMRMYRFDKDAPKKINTYPISVGRRDWTTPHGEMVVSGKLESPAWYPPASILKEHAEMGDPLPRVVGPGPDNPLGKYALLLSKTGYLIHGTNKPYGIGMRVTHGCIRMYPKHIKTVFEKINIGEKVRIINQPIKVGVINGVALLEAHPSLTEDAVGLSKRYAMAIETIRQNFENVTLKLSYGILQQTITDETGVPTAIGTLTY